MCVRPCVPRWGVENVAANLITHAFPWLPVLKSEIAGQEVEDKWDMPTDGRVA